MSTKIYRAVSKLSAKLRWCLTGTPVQNSLEDLASLIAFIRASPLDNLPDFRTHIISPLVKGTDRGLNNLRLLLDSICLRRTNKLIDLSDLIDEDRIVEFSASERNLYSSAQKQMINAVKQCDSQKRNAKGYFGVFQLQLQLRRLCNHGTFQKAFSPLQDGELQFDPQQALGFLRKRKSAKCIYCAIVVTGFSIAAGTRGHFTFCGHLLCAQCVPRYEKALKSEGQGSSIRCSLCLQKVNGNYLADDTIMENRVTPTLSTASKCFEESGICSKISALIKDLMHNDSAGKRYLLRI